MCVILLNISVSKIDELSSRLIPLFLKTPPENIVLLKSILESYEHLGELRTLDPKTGELVILALSDTEETVRSLLNSLIGKYNVRFIPQPKIRTKDWLMAELKLQE